MKVALVIKALSVPGGGAERIFVNLAKYLADQGYQVRVITFDSADQESFYGLEDDIPWTRLDIGNALRRARLSETLRRMRALRRTILADRPDVVIGFMHSSYVPLAFSLVGSRVPIIGSEHIVVEHYATRKLQYLLLLLSSFFVTRFTVLSETIRSNYAWPFRRKAVVMPNPVFAPTLPADMPHKGGRYLILSVGKLEPQKDHLTLIRAFHSLADQFPHWDLRIVGEGSMRPQLEAEVARLQLSSRVTLPGAIREIGKEYASADIFALPSRYESFGLVTLEAMSAGLPVIGFADCPGTNEVITSGVNGILVGAGDRVEQLAVAIGKLVASHTLRAQLGTRGEAEAHRFLPRQVFAQWEHLLADITKRHD